MNEWRQSTWGDEVTLEYGKALRDYSETAGRVRVFGTNGPIGWTDTALAPGPGVVLGRKGAYRGVRYSREPFFVIDTAYYVVPKAKLEMRWLYYAIIHHQLGLIDDGSPIPSTTRAAVYPRAIAVPPLAEQHAIVGILGALDDKLEQNRRTALALERLARATFRAWFVDFEPVKAKAAGATAFPSMPQPVFDALPTSFVDSDIGPVPDRWETSTVGNCASYLSRGIAPRYVEDVGVLVLNQKCIRDFAVDYRKARRHDNLARRIDGREIQIGDVLINSTGVGTLGRLAQVLHLPEAAVVDTHVTVVRPRSGISVSYFGQALISMQTHIESLGEASTRRSSAD